MKINSLIILLILNFSAFGQQPVENLVFEGAGIRGLAYAGAIQVLEEKDQLKSLHRIAGTSAGAITACLLAFHYSASDIEDLVSNTQFQSFNQGRFFFFGGLHRIYRHYGWYRTGRFEHWLSKLIQAKTGRADLTFQEMHDLGYPDLFIPVTCINLQRTLCLSYRTFPQMRITDAVTASMSVPLYFEPVILDEQGTKRFKRFSKNAAYILVDGGLSANFPLHLFDTIPGSHPERTLGIKIDQEEQIKLDKTMQHLSPQSTKTFRLYSSAIYIYTLESMNQSSLQAQDSSRIIALSSCGIGPRVKRLKPADKAKLVQQARLQTGLFFTK